MGLKRFILLVALVCIAMGMQTPISGAEIKMGYIDSQKILEQYKPYQDALKEYSRYEEELSREINKQQNDLVKMQENYERQALLLSDKRKQEEQQAILKKRQGLERFVQETTDPSRGKLAQKQASLSEPIYRRINEIIKKVAENDGYDFVLNTASLAFAKEDYDLTEKVLEELQRDDEARGQIGQ